MPPQPLSIADTVAIVPSRATRLQAFLASAGLVVLACLAYRWAPFEFHRKQFGELYGLGGIRFTGAEFMFWAAAAYIAALAAYHARLSDGAPSKALVAWRWLVRLARGPARALRAPLAADDRLALLCCLLKAFFAPMMVMSMMIFCVGAVGNALALAFGSEPGEGWLRGRSFWLLLHLILFVDVLVFTFGYLVELPRLGNQIRSVDPSPIGWAAALVCYPPFNSVTAYVYGSTASDFPQFDDPTAHALGNALLLAMMALYAWASVALGWKGSNLTHRGIVAHGPYRFVRHPAYICKNTAWWIGSLPLFAKAFEQSWTAGGAALLTMASWSAIYLLRALTEEDHLRRVDGDYAAYAARVRWRFIPGLV
jgi:protein-S-isoprenylcysteine O-methyltransferase Ste14